MNLLLKNILLTFNTNRNYKALYFVTYLNISTKKRKTFKAMGLKISKKNLNFKNQVQIQKCVSANKISHEFIEPFINEGYRQSNQPYTVYIKSVFYLNNETLNFWTHFLPFLIAVFYVIYFYSKIYVDYYFFPCFLYLVSICSYLLMSSIAHMFNSMSSTSRQLCFILDYLGIDVIYLLFRLKIQFRKKNEFQTNHMLI